MHTKLFTFFVCLILSLQISSATYTSTSNGTWSVTTNWSGGSSPSTTGGGNNTINVNNTLTLTTTGFNLGNNSVLNICNTCTLTIVGNITFSNGSTLNLPLGAVLIINGNVTNNNNSNKVFVDGTLTINGSFTGGGGSSVSSPSGTGSIAITGSVTTTGSGSVFGSQVDCTSNCNSTSVNPLPIDLIFFLLEKQSNSVLLKWRAGNKESIFTLQKSDDGVTWMNFDVEFKDMYDYAFVDLTPYSPFSYYRLMQDKGYEVFYSNVLSIEFNNDLIELVSVNPNPIKQGEDIRIAFSGEEQEIVVVSVVGLTGVEYIKQSFFLTDVKRTIAVSSERLLPGMYIVNIFSDGSILSGKIIIK